MVPLSIYQGVLFKNIYKGGLVTLNIKDGQGPYLLNHVQMPRIHAKGANANIAFTFKSKYQGYSHFHEHQPSMQQWQLSGYK